MPAEPITLLSPRASPAGALELLRSLADSVRVVGPDDGWDKLVAAAMHFGLGPAPTLTLARAGDGARVARAAQACVGSFPDAERRPALMRALGACRLALATEWSPERGPHGDVRLALLYAVAAALDGLLFSPSAVLDAQGRTLLDVEGHADPAAALPPVPVEAPSALAPQPPTPEQAARRALALAAVCARALLEQAGPDQADAEANRARIAAWAGALALAPEMPAVGLDAPVGSLEPQATTDATWRLEGLAVLAWALNCFPLPAHDALAEPWPLLSAVGFLDLEAARALLAGPTLRPAEALLALHRQLLAVHERLAEQLFRPGPRDFPRAAGAAFEPLGLGPLRLAGNDLALGEGAVADAPEEEVRGALSAAQERLWACTWLLGWPEEEEEGP